MVTGIAEKAVSASKSGVPKARAVTVVKQVNELYFV